jgi:predicted nucleic acid-binding protein
MTRQTPTNRQLAASIRFGRKVTLETPELERTKNTGYVVGFDDNDIHLAIIVGGQIRRTGYNRSYVASIQWHSDSTLSTENPAVKKELEDQLRAVRSRINDEYFHNGAKR